MAAGGGSRQKSGSQENLVTLENGTRFVSCEVLEARETEI